MHILCTSVVSKLAYRRRTEFEHQTVVFISCMYIEHPRHNSRHSHGAELHSSITFRWKFCSFFIVKRGWMMKVTFFKDTLELNCAYCL